VPGITAVRSTSYRKEKPLLNETSFLIIFSMSENSFQCSVLSLLNIYKNHPLSSSLENNEHSFLVTHPCVIQEYAHSKSFERDRCNRNDKQIWYVVAVPRKCLFA